LSPDASLARAQDLIRSGQVARGRDEVLREVDLAPTDRALHDEAIVLLGEAGLADEAAWLAERYEQRFGERPVEALEEARALAAGAGEQRTFRRVRRTRDGLFNAWAPARREQIDEVTVLDDAIVLSARDGEHRIAWDELDGARLEKRRDAVDISVTFAEAYTRRVVVLPARGREFRLDVSSRMPEWDNAAALERAIAARVQLRPVELAPVTPEAKRARKDRIAFVVLAAIIAAALLYEYVL
jgi:hypothetical protein